MIEQFSAVRARNVRGTIVAIEQPLYAVKKGGMYFIWCYTDKTFAERMDEKLSGPSNPADEAANWRRNIRELVPSGRTTFR